jgi:hypothetical protein
MAQYFVKVWVEVDADSEEEAYRKAASGEWLSDSIDSDGVSAAVGTVVRGEDY